LGVMRQEEKNGPKQGRAGCKRLRERTRKAGVKEECGRRKEKCPLEVGPGNRIQWVGKKKKGQKSFVVSKI